MTRLAVINVVGLTERLIGEHTPRIAEYVKRGALARIGPAFPAVTCAAQANYLTGKLPSQHGIVGNGWYHRELAEVQFWKQSNHLVQSPKIWDELRERFTLHAPAAPKPPGEGGSRFTVSNLFWWFNMYSSADYAITPRPIYRADGGKVFDIYSWPYSLRTEIKRDLGEFPFFGFWGPAAGIKTPQGAADCATRWIAAAAKWMEAKYAPTLSLIYLPHLDYNLQRHGIYAASRAGSPPPAAGRASSPPPVADRAGNPLPAAGGASVPASRLVSSLAPPETARPLNPIIIPDLRAIDAIVGDLLEFFGRHGVKVVLLSEYGITNVNQPIHLNRIFRERGWLTVKDELGLEILDAGASKVFAVADHQVAHVYLNDRSLEKPVRELLEKTPGVEKVLDEAEKAAAGIAHSRAGDLIAVAGEDAWFTYYYWLEDQQAPDFARTVDIHRKPGYDPMELFLDPKIRLPKLKIGWRLLQKRLGLRMLMDVIPLDATLAKGSHGRRPADPKDWPVFITEHSGFSTDSTMESPEVYQALLKSFQETGE